MASYAMRNYLGVAITGAISVFIGAFAYRQGDAAFRGRAVDPAPSA